MCLSGPTVSCRWQHHVDKAHVCRIKVVDDFSLASCWERQAVDTAKPCDKERYLILGYLVNGSGATSRGRLSVTTSYIQDGALSREAVWNAGHIDRQIIKVFKLARSRCCLIADKDSGGVQAWVMRLPKSRNCMYAQSRKSNLRHFQHHHPKPDCCQCFTLAANTAQPHTVDGPGLQRHHHIPCTILHPDHTVYSTAKTAPQAKSGNRRLHFHSPHLSVLLPSVRPPLPLHWVAEHLST